MIKRGSKLFCAHGGAIREFTVIDIYLVDEDNCFPIPEIVMEDNNGRQEVYSKYPMTGLLKTYEEAEKRLKHYHRERVI